MAGENNEPPADATNELTWNLRNHHPTKTLDMADGMVNTAVGSTERHESEVLLSDHDTAVHDPATDEELLDLNEYVGDGQIKYELRQKARQLKGNFTRTWIDDDMTGLYDPNEEQRKLRQRPRRPNPLLRRGTFNPWNLQESDEESDGPTERLPKLIPKLEVTIKFRSETGKAAYEKHMKDLPAEPERSEKLYSERRLRRRDSAVDFSHSLSSRPTKRKRLPDDLPENLTGHPIARGCWECLTIGIRCPLLDDDRAWPCTTCVDDDNECELITPPTYKRACEHCKSRRFGCSYTYTLGHAEPCEECSRTGWRCVAGPAKEAIRERISYERDWENDPWQEPKAPKAKKLPSCRRCRERGQLCSFSSGDKSDVCTACDMGGAECLPELGKLQSSRKRKRAQNNSKHTHDNDHDGEKDEADIGGPEIFGSVTNKHDPIIMGESSDSSDNDIGIRRIPKKPKTNQLAISGIDDSSSDDSDFESLLEKLESKSESTPKSKPNTIRPKQIKNTDEGTLKAVSTKFAHPIVFNYDGKEACHFCNDIRFPMFGLGSTDVEVVVWNDGRGLEEISGGHRGQNIENTRMCISCTTKRMPMVMCGKHELRRMPGDMRADLAAMIQG